MVETMEMEFIKKIEDIEDKWDDKRRNSKDEIFSFLADTLFKELEEYDVLIHRFFSRDGEEKRIRSMFSELRNLENEITIQAVDVSYASNVYEEYTDGMIEFIQEVFSLNYDENEVEKFTKYEENLLKATENDSIFIDSLFGGINNPESEETVKSAVSNVNFLVNFLNEMKNYHLKIGKLKISNPYNQLAIDSFSLVVSSISKYCSKMIITILKTYCNINDALSGKKPVNTDTTFKIF